MPKSYDLEQIEILPDEELRIFCYDTPEFKSVYDYLVQGVDRSQLLEWIKEVQVIPDKRHRIIDSETPDYYDLPAKAYHELVGRDQVLGKMIDALRDVNGKWIVAVDGMGGIGKTALAHEVANLCLEEGIFDSIIWIQSPKLQPLMKPKKKFFHRLWEVFRSNPPQLQQDLAPSLTYEIVLNSILRRLGNLEAIKLKLGEKEASVRSLLRAQPILVILDNMETASESQNDIASRLQHLLNPAKALFTSRHRFLKDIYPIHLSGLDEEGTAHLIEQLARERGNIEIEAIQQNEMQQIHAVTGGSPLAVKHVVGQLQVLPLEVVLNQLQHIPPPKREGNDDDDLRFYKNIFLPSWDLLSEDSKDLLIAMTHFAPNIGGTLEAVTEISDLIDGVLQSCIKELWLYSFIEISEATSLNKKRYYLLPLTQHFILSDIVKIL